jgi:hypothetical protein
VADLAGAAAGSLSAADLAKIAAGWVIINGILTPPVVPKRQYEPLGPTKFGTVGRVNIPGTQPGLFQNVPAQYQTTSPVQSKFYYGQRPLQIGTNFSPEQYRAVAAPATPWGLQQMYTPLNINQYVAEQAARTQQAVAPAPAPGPVIPR